MPVAPFDPGRLSGLTDGASAGSLGLRWVAASHYLDTAEARSAALHAILDDVAAGRIEPRIGHRLPLEAAGAAHQLLEQRRANGKVLLLITVAGLLIIGPLDDTAFGNVSWIVAMPAFLLGVPPGARQSRSCSSPDAPRGQDADRRVVSTGAAAACPLRCAPAESATSQPDTT